MLFGEVLRVDLLLLHFNCIIPLVLCLMYSYTNTKQLSSLELHDHIPTSAQSWKYTITMLI